MLKRRSLQRMWVFPLLVLVALALVCGGCTEVDEKDKQPDTKGTATVTLYFSDDQAMYLVPEERKVTVDTVVGEAVVKGLIAGPEGDTLGATIPQGTKLLSYTEQDGIATVNFSKEIQTNHSGGSTGESMTIYSIVNSLTKLDGIHKVQLLVEGQKIETLAGHFDTSEPLEPDNNLVKA